ncbi:MAG: hypothetical protein GY854_35255 [Deltaproteobacteria bacterium]|nr:hypothetical protein [Deltaproteobacteria bacterium]
MSAQAKRPKRPADRNALAAAIVGEATAEPTEPKQALAESVKNPAAVALGRLGGLKGGKARAKKLTPEERRAIAKRAAHARWNNKILL